jgi:hypothetical protein
MTETSGVFALVTALEDCPACGHVIARTEIFDRVSLLI